MDKLDYYNVWELDNCFEMVMDVLCCLEGDVFIKVFFGGEWRRVVLCCLLLSNLDILFLDEFINYLDVEFVYWLE